MTAGVDLTPVTIGGRQSARAGTVDWLTPRWILDQLGVFDLDPCAAPNPGEWPTARRHITRPDDGLAAEWDGRVWLNPPYAAEAKHWMRRLAEHGNGIALLFGRTETDWFFGNVWNAPTATGVLFLRGRVKFVRPGTYDAPDNGGAPSVLIAYGNTNAQLLYARQAALRGAYLEIGSRPNPLTYPGTLNTPAARLTGLCDRCATAH